MRTALEATGVVVVEATSGAEGLARARSERPALVVLDLGLPDMDGRAVCGGLRAWTSTPILVVSARHSDREKAELLDAGADDYITKPFSVIELQARVRAQLRRGGAGPLPAGETTTVEADGLVVDIAARAVRRGATTLHLTRTEWQLLEALVTARGRTLTHRQLFDLVWGRAHGDAQQYLRVYVAHLRRKIERDPLRPVLIVTEPGVGYRFVVPGGGDR